MSRRNDETSMSRTFRRVASIGIIVLALVLVVLVAARGRGADDVTSTSQNDGG